MTCSHEALAEGLLLFTSERWSVYVFSAGVRQGIKVVAAFLTEIFQTIYSHIYLFE